MELRVLVIAGPTASGKTALAIELGRQLGAEIVNADSRQVYRYLDIGTAKPTLAERAEVAHHLLDLVDPDEKFNVARFRKAALAAISDLVARGRRIIVCGGTGLYLRALTRGLFSGPAADARLREQFAEIERREGPGALWQRLFERDRETAARLHPNDLVRVVRALEVLEITGRPISSWQQEHKFGERRFNYVMLGLRPERSLLYTLIEGRCQAMIDKGLVKEITRLYDLGYGPELAPLKSLGYRELGSYVRGEVAFDVAFNRFVQATRRFAKRQLAWFNKEPRLWWGDPTREREEIVGAARSFLEKGCLPHTLTSNSL